MQVLKYLKNQSALKMFYEERNSSSVLVMPQGYKMCEPCLFARKLRRAPLNHTVPDQRSALDNVRGKGLRLLILLS